MQDENDTLQQLPSLRRSYTPDPGLWLTRERMFFDDIPHMQVGFRFWIP